MNSYVNTSEMKQFFDMLDNGYHYEFGIGGGNSILTTLNLTSQRNPFHGIIAFDSLEGLPEEHPDVWHNPDWKPGVFSTQDDFQVTTKDEAIQCLRNKWGPRNNEVDIVVGWYSETLTELLAKELRYKRANYIHVDCDIYLSCLELMDWIFKHDLAQIDSLWRFDDIFGTELWKAGESLALKQITHKYKLNWQQLYGNIFIYKGRA